MPFKDISYLELYPLATLLFSGVEPFVQIEGIMRNISGKLEGILTNASGDVV